MIRFALEDRVTMITGAAGNLGLPTAMKFREEGARLALVDRHMDILVEAFPDLVDNPDCLLIACADLTDIDEVGSVVRQAVDRFGRVDVLVHTVGGFWSGTPLHETSLDTLNDMFVINAGTVFITNRAVVPHMLDQGYGKIINIAARPGLKGRSNMAAYSAAKAAVIRLTESIADEVRSYGINVNCVIPGTIDTPQNRQADPDATTDAWVKPESLADVILFLASEAARDIHGAAIPVFGLT